METGANNNPRETRLTRAPAHSIPARYAHAEQEAKALQGVWARRGELSLSEVRPAKVEPLLHCPDIPGRVAPVHFVWPLTSSPCVRPRRAGTACSQLSCLHGFVSVSPFPLLSSPPPLLLSYAFPLLTAY